MANSQPIHYELADMIIEMMSKGSHRRVSHDKVNTSGHYESFQMDSATFMLDQEIAIVDLTIYDDLKLNGIKLLIKIQKELQVNNPIWEFKEKHLSESRSGLVQLREKDILRQINSTDFYIVNPEKIRRGKPLAVLASIYTYCKNQYEKDKRWRLGSADIKRLVTPRGEVKFIKKADDDITIDIN